MHSFPEIQDKEGEKTIIDASVSVKDDAITAGKNGFVPDPGGSTLIHWQVTREGT